MIRKLTPAQRWLADHVSQLQTNIDLLDDNAPLYILDSLRTRQTFYQLLQLTKENDISPAVTRLVVRYEQEVTRLYFHKEKCSYYVLHLLKLRLAIESESIDKVRLSKAIYLVEMKLALYSVDVKLLQIEIANSLNIEWLPSDTAEQLLMRKRKYYSYNSIVLKYSNGNISAHFSINDPKYLDEDVLEDLVFVLGEGAADNGIDMAVDALAEALAMNERVREQSSSNLDFLLG